MTRTTLLLLAASLMASGAASGGESAEARFAEAGALARAGDYPKAVASWSALAAEGHESASLYWNWAQAAAARGARGESLWALLRARELAPGDHAVLREALRVRESLALDAAEVSPDPRSELRRWGRRLHLDLVAALLLAVSLGARGAASVGRIRRGAVVMAWSSGILGALVVSGLAVVSTAEAQAVVVRKGAPLIDSASPTAEIVGALREGEVVPVLDSSSEWIRVEDSSGARGWAHVDDVRRLDRAPGR